MKLKKLLFALPLIIAFTSCTNNININDNTQNTDLSYLLEFNTPYGTLDEDKNFVPEIMFKDDGMLYAYSKDTNEYVESTLYFISYNTILTQAFYYNPSVGVNGLDWNSYYLQKKGCLLVEYIRIMAKDTMPTRTIYYSITEEFARNTPGDELDFYLQSYGRIM